MSTYPMNSLLDVSDAIRQARTEAGYTQEQLAEDTGLSRAAVAKWEAGTAFPNVTSLLTVARVLGVTFTINASRKICELTDDPYTKEE